MFDKEYHNRVIDWGGGYPRPMYEIIRKRYFGYDDHKEKSKYNVSHHESEYFKEGLEKERKRIEDEKKKKLMEE